MSPAKLAILAAYAVLIAVAILMVGSTAATFATGLLLLLAVAHLVEMAVFYQRCQAAGGSMAGHMLQVFLFGVFHVKEIKAAAGENQAGA